ncbi:MAG TPA: RlmE family RNA methyltransferase [Candidatus Binatia bacterium]
MYQRKDAFYARAKTAGYRSRAAFKLLQLAQRGRLFRRGDHVVDLGAWPGGWLQVASELVGPAGTVVGVDLQPIGRLPQQNVVTFVGDIAAESTQQEIARACQGRVDVVLSDLAPKLSGVRARDEAQVQVLAECVLAFVEKVLKPGGKLVIKLFMGDDLPRYVDQLRARFTEVRTTRPEATRKGSAEVYAIANNFRGGGQQ